MNIFDVDYLNVYMNTYLLETKPYLEEQGGVRLVLIGHVLPGVLRVGLDPLTWVPRGGHGHRALEVLRRVL